MRKPRAKAGRSSFWFWDGRLEGLSHPALFRWLRGFCGQYARRGNADLLQGLAFRLLRGYIGKMLRIVLGILGFAGVCLGLASFHAAALILIGIFAAGCIIDVALNGFQPAAPRRTKPGPKH